MRGIPPDDYVAIIESALKTLRHDPASRPLFLRAVEADDSYVVYHGIAALAAQRDESALVAIDRALSRFPARSALAILLADYQSPSAEALAMKHLDEEGREKYAERRPGKGWLID